MNDETRKKRDELAGKWAERGLIGDWSMHGNFCTGFDAGYALAKEQEDEALRVAVEALEEWKSMNLSSVPNKALAEIRKLKGEV